MTDILDKNKLVVSIESIQLSDIAIQLRDLNENVVSTQLNLFDKQRHELFDELQTSESMHQFLKLVSYECELIHIYLLDRINKLKVEEKIIEQIIPILSDIDFFKH